MLSNCSIYLNDCLRSQRMYQLIIFILILLIFYNYKETNNIIVEQPQKTNNIIVEQPPNKYPEMITYSTNLNNVSNRDYNQMYNPLYPPYNRTDAYTAQTIINNKNNGLMNVNSQNVYDTPRLIGYFYDKQNDYEHIYKLYGFEKNRNESVFYYSFSNDNLKYVLNKKNSNLRTLYDLPKELQIKEGPVKGLFKLDELPKTDFETNYL